ncbi:HlyD family efflux transporter periplasmic adaptor subunit [Methylobacillus flagellatus]|uniref:HlyD family secretion protein n=1 Tax=Methylobacillus flagellatus TaxID=405 RepID=UPI002853D68F|nr:HlyD family efflux transporter periplasmic adaptor subunit [Methylobacillus flagellatus]MDR5172893.1 HlyD family efflux transporter periplasmic adaptor subunit [Methylobacillus flagellatus]
MNPKIKKFAPLVIIAALAVGGFYAWQAMNGNSNTEGLASGNGRIEAIEIDVATKLAGRVDEILVNEGDFVEKGQPLANMQVQVLDAQRDEARAQHQQALNSVVAAQAQVALRESDKRATQALVTQRESELDAAQRRLARSETLSAEGASSIQELDDDRARVRSAQAAVEAAKAQVAASQAAIDAAKAQVIGASSTVAAAEATIARIEADITDSQLTSPRAGRVQYRVAQPGEVLAGGGKVLNLVDLSDVYMTFFLPEAAAGKLAMGAEARIILDAAPQYVIPATISFVASTAQFTPKTVETESERQKLMFRVKAQIDRELLQKHLKLVKTGLPGVAWVKVDNQAEWPAELAVKVPE